MKRSWKKSLVVSAALLFAALITANMLRGGFIQNVIASGQYDWVDTTPIAMQESSVGDYYGSCSGNLTVMGSNSCGTSCDSAADVGKKCRAMTCSGNISYLHVYTCKGPAAPSCTPSSACAANTCSTSTCSNGCGGTVNGTKTCSVSCSVSNSCGKTSTSGTVVNGVCNAPTPSEASCTTTTPTPPVVTPPPSPPPSPPPATKSMTCDVSQADRTIVEGETVHFGTTRSGISSPYVWTDSDGVFAACTRSSCDRTYSVAGMYSMIVRASGVTARCATITVQGNSCTTGTPVPTITATPSRVRAGQTSTISWNASNVPDGGSCTVMGPGVNTSTGAAGAAPTCAVPSGSATVTISSQSTYTITCGSASSNVTVNMAPAFSEF